MIYQPSHSPESNLNKSISPESSISIHVQNNSKTLDHKNVFNSRSPFIFSTSLQKNDNKNVEEKSTNNTSKYLYSKTDCFDCMDIFDFEHDQQQLDIGYNNSEQGSSNDLKAQRDAAMGELDTLLSQIDSVFGIIKKAIC
ncbi:Hypothetical protein SRAE_1000176500 [Strongyloides ratti]|uniref:Uncharacterized protein n=1 Tax=Strongyloides ratti TaxID=34506 RepID=A0A090L7J8_STRRB|nr:Hypothetical protein SRAE_1000176500 [Strongyloides ratti]CEF63504.2 Hypothetical protein SRAE_1000176500 [Strongyloides ratti]